MKVRIMREWPPNAATCTLHILMPQSVQLASVSDGSIHVPRSSSLPASVTVKCKSGEGNYANLQTHLFQGSNCTSSDTFNECTFHTRVEFGLVSLGFPCFLRLSSAGLIVLLIPGCCWAHSAFSV